MHLGQSPPKGHQLGVVHLCERDRRLSCNIGALSWHAHALTLLLSDRRFSRVAFSAASRSSSTRSLLSWADSCWAARARAVSSASRARSEAVAASVCNPEEHGGGCQKRGGVVSSPAKGQVHTLASVTSRRACTSSVSRRRYSCSADSTRRCDSRALARQTSWLRLLLQEGETIS